MHRFCAINQNMINIVEISLLHAVVMEENNTLWLGVYSQLLSIFSFPFKFNILS